MLASSKCSLQEAEDSIARLEMRLEQYEIHMARGGSSDRVVANDLTRARSAYERANAVRDEIRGRRKWKGRLSGDLTAHLNQLPLVLVGFAPSRSFDLHQSARGHERYGAVFALRDDPFRMSAFGTAAPKFPLLRTAANCRSSLL
jgi:hypothetical protein